MRRTCSSPAGRFEGGGGAALGLVDAANGRGPACCRRAAALAAEIAANAPLAVRSTRKTLRAELAAAVKAATDHEFVEQQWLMKTDDFKEGVKSVAERRPGNFKGK